MEFKIQFLPLITSLYSIEIGSTILISAEEPISSGPKSQSNNKTILICYSGI